MRKINLIEKTSLLYIKKRNSNIKLYKDNIAAVITTQIEKTAFLKEVNFKLLPFSSRQVLLFIYDYRVY